MFRLSEDMAQALLHLLTHNNTEREKYVKTYPIRDFGWGMSADKVSRLPEFEKPLQAKALNLQKREFTQT